MIRELMFANYMAQMSNTVGVTCDMGKEGRSELDVGNGWVEHERPDGRKFYVNNETGKRTWVRPRDILPEQDFQKCSAFVQKMKYEGRYPKGLETVANDGYDCESFLEKLYDMNESKWTKEGYRAEAEASARPALPSYRNPNKPSAADPLTTDPQDTWAPSGTR